MKTFEDLRLRLESIRKTLKYDNVSFFVRSDDEAVTCVVSYSTNKSLCNITKICEVTKANCDVGIDFLLKEVNEKLNSFLFDYQKKLLSKKQSINDWLTEIELLCIHENNANTL